MGELEIYRHFKGGTYVKLCEAIDSETLEDIVVYISVQNGKIFTRSKKMFNEIIFKDNFYGPRFCKI